MRQWLIGNACLLWHPFALANTHTFLSDNDDFDWGMNVKSCAICSSFSKYDAMDLVPYMCASDDVMSDQGEQGLRRTGTIAVGAHQCDFRYKSGGEPQHIAEEYPERIRLKVV